MYRGNYNAFDDAAKNLKTAIGWKADISKREKRDRASHKQ